MKNIPTRVTRNRLASRLFVAFCLLCLLAGGSSVRAQTQVDGWALLQAGQTERSTAKKAAAVAALGLLPGDPRSRALAERALHDQEPVVRAAAACALGQMGAKDSILILKEMLVDKDAAVFFAAADSLLALGDPAGYDVYYEVLMGERKSGHTLMAEQKRMVKDSKAMTLAAFGVAIGYAPYASSAWMFYRVVSKDYGLPVRVEALKKLASDPDPRINGEMVKAASDRNWRVRAAALSAIARHGDPALIPTAVAGMSDKCRWVRYMAAAASVRLSVVSTAVVPGQR